MNQQTEGGVSLARTLKERTADHHHRAERHPIQGAIARGQIELTTFGLWLAQLQAIHRALETRLTEQASRDERVGALFVPHHRRAAALERDLDSLSIDAASRRTLPATERFVVWIDQLAARSPSALIGVLYVFEGSTNGGQYLARALRRSPHFADGRGLSALDPHGERTTELWGQFRASLDALPFDSSERDAIVAAAAATFDAMSSVLDDVAAQAGAAQATSGPH
jgi:heme oxygenase